MKSNKTARERVSAVIEASGVFSDNQTEAQHYLINLRAASYLSRTKRRGVSIAKDSANTMQWTVKCKTCGRFKSGGSACVHCEQRKLGIFALTRNTTGIGGPAGTGWSEEQKSACRELIGKMLVESRKKGPQGFGRAWKNREEVISVLSKKVAEDIHAANKNLTIEVGSSLAIDIKQIVHALEGHGKNAKTRPPYEIELTEADLLLIPDVLSDYDMVATGLGTSDGKPSEVVEFWKRLGDKMMVCASVERLSADGKAAHLKFQTMLKFRDV